MVRNEEKKKKRNTYTVNSRAIHLRKRPCLRQLDRRIDIDIIEWHFRPIEPFKKVLEMIENSLKRS